MTKDTGKKWRAFRSARKFARSLGLRFENAWVRYCRGEMKDKARKPDDVPRNPWIIYRKRGWKGMGDWLGATMPRMKHWRIFVHARAYARALGLSTGREWYAFCTGKLRGKDARPLDIPASPQTVYRDKGWRGWGDWVGTGRVATYNKRFRPFPPARALARTLKLRSQAEWLAYCKGVIPGKGTRPDDIPTNPCQIYRMRGWKGMGDWLGTGNVALWLRKFRPFEEARAFARSLRLRNSDEWRKFCKGLIPAKGRRPDDIPTTPGNSYRHCGWCSMGDWLGTGTVSSMFRTFRLFREARTFVRALKLRSHDEWIAYCAGKLPDKGTRPSDIPTTPSRTYRNRGWRGWLDWLGTENIRGPEQFRPFEEARAFARSLNLSGEHKWRKFLRGSLRGKGKKPNNIPACPQLVYRDKGWCGWGDWFGTGNVQPSQKRFLPFQKARIFARSLKLRGSKDWYMFCAGTLPKKGKRPPDIPSSPRQTYRASGWQGMGDWLGTGNVATCLRVFLPFGKARSYARMLGLKSVEEWRKFCKGLMPDKGTRPPDIPADPRTGYRGKGWRGWPDWLGTKNVRRRVNT